MIRIIYSSPEVCHFHFVAFWFSVIEKDCTVFDILKLNFLSETYSVCTLIKLVQEPSPPPFFAIKKPVSL